MSTNPSPFTDLRKSIVQDIMSKIVSPNMGWSSDSNQAYEARLEIGDAIEELLNDIDYYFQPTSESNH